MKKVMIYLFVVFGFGFNSYAEDIQCKENKAICFSEENNNIETLIEKEIENFNLKTKKITEEKQIKYSDTSYNKSYQEKMINNIQLSFEFWKKYRDSVCISSYYEDQMSSSYDVIVKECILEMTKIYYSNITNRLNNKLLDWEL